MRHSVDGQQERPNLLLNSTRNRIPTINILSSLENRQNLKSDDKSSHKKGWGITLLIALAIAIICLVQFGDSQNLHQNPNFSFTSFFVPANSANPGSSTPSNTKQLAPAKQQDELATPTPTIIDEEKLAVESSAVLVDVTPEKEKIEAVNAVLSNPKLLEARAVVPQVKVMMQKHASKGEKHVNRGNKEPQKTRASAEKNEPKAFDSDVALLSALVANTSKSKEPLSGILGNSSNAKPNVSPPVNLDVVERNPGDNTKNLLSRCEKLGGAEAKLCHARICSGARQTETVCALSKGLAD